MPAAISAWWYPGERSGYGFMYPKDQARRLAEGAGQPGLTTQARATGPRRNEQAGLGREARGRASLPLLQGVDTSVEFHDDDSRVVRQHTARAPHDFIK